MRFPVGKLGTLEEYQKFWYDAQPFGNKTAYGYHEGVDLNLKTGGDTDLGEPLYAVADGKIVYYHLNTHPATGFGKHMVLECYIPNIGRRWFHYAHCEEITATVKDVKEGGQIGRLGKSGTEHAHLHFAIFKVDPKTLRSGIDTVAKTLTELNDWWQNPMDILNLATQTVPPVPSWFSTLLQESNLSLEREGEFRAFWEKAKRYDQEILQLQEQVKSANETLSEKTIEVSDLITKNQKLQGKIDALQEQLFKNQEKRSETETELNKTLLKLHQINQEAEKYQKMIDDITEKYNTLKNDYSELEKKSVYSLSTPRLIGIILGRILSRG